MWPCDAGREPDHRLDELGLAAAGDAGDADDLAGRDDEVDAVDATVALVVVDVERRRISSTGCAGVVLRMARASGRPRRPVIASDSSAGEVVGGRHLVRRLGRDAARSPGR